MFRGKSQCRSDLFKSRLDCIRTFVFRQGKQGSGTSVETPTEERKNMELIGLDGDLTSLDETSVL